MGKLADGSISYYESKDFKENYKEHLFTDTNACIQRIMAITRGYDFQQKYGSYIYTTYDQAEKILDHIIENQEEFMRDMTSWYTGGRDITSVEFGEQEEQLSGIWNKELHKEYPIEEVKADYEDNGSFIINGDFAYYDMSGSGVYVDFFAQDLPTDLLSEIA